MPAAGGEHQRPWCRERRRLRVSAGLEQAPRPRRRCRSPRRAAAAWTPPRRVVAFTLAPARSSMLGQRRVAVHRGPVQRGHAVALRRVDVGAALQQRARRPRDRRPSPRPPPRLGDCPAPTRPTARTPRPCAPRRSNPSALAPCCDSSCSALRASRPSATRPRPCLGRSVQIERARAVAELLHIVEARACAAC